MCNNLTKVLFTIHCRRQNFCPSLLRLVDRLTIHGYLLFQKTRAKVLPSATAMGEFELGFYMMFDPNMVCLATVSVFLVSIEFKTISIYKLWPGDER